MKLKLVEKVVIVCFAIIPFLMMAQNHRFIYEYSFKKDSLNRDKVEKELMNLDIFKEGSKFYSHVKQIHDSLITGLLQKEYAEGQHPDFGSIEYRSKIDFSVEKLYPKYQSIFKTLVGGEMVSVKDKDLMKWTISNENKIIEGMKAQKATTNFGGRNWTAWFANDIHFPDGPFKFYGLPGLILNIEDEKKDHVFTFVGSKKLNYTPEKLGEVYGEEISLTRDKFKKFWSDFKKDPSKSMRLKYANEEFYATDENGEVIPASKMIKGAEEYAKKRVLTDNNFIELTLYR